MKLTLSLTLSFLLFALIITKLSIAFSSYEQVLDSNGHPIFPGDSYYIVPVNQRVEGGSVRLGKTGGSKCPITVLQSYSEVVRGIPVRFVIPWISSGEIYIGTSLEIEFLEKPSCSKSSRWLVFVDNDIKKSCVGIGGPENYPGMKTQSGVFRIQKSKPFDYKLVFCDGAESENCWDIGRFDNHNNEGGRRLVLTKQDPFTVLFRKADT